MVASARPGPAGFFLPLSFCVIPCFVLSLKFLFGSCDVAFTSGAAASFGLHAARGSRGSGDELFDRLLRGKAAAPDH